MLKFIIAALLTGLIFWLALAGQGSKDFVYLMEPWIWLCIAIAVSIVVWVGVAVLL